MKQNDEILIEGLELPVRIGVPDEERSGWQVLRVDVRLELFARFDEMQDELTETIDYAVLAERMRKEAAERPRKLLEVLASELVVLLLQPAKVAAVELTLRKRILPGTDFVAVKMRRHKEPHS